MKEKDLNDTLSDVKVELNGYKKDPKQVLKNVEIGLELMTNLHSLYRKADNSEKS